MATLVMDGGDDTQPQKRRARKSRGRGLRTKTGCLTCRGRHKKCDERLPVCGPCTVSSRHCIFPQDLDAQATLEALNNAPRHALDNACKNNDRQGTSVTTVSHSPPALASHASNLSLTTHNDIVPHNSQVSLSIHQVPPHEVNVRALNTIHLGFSPESISSELWTADFASTRWLDLLANDAAQADSGFSLAPSPAPEDQNQDQRARLLVSTHVSPALLNGQAELPADSDPEAERRTWQTDTSVTLTNREAVLFRHFTDRCAGWLDLFDPQKPFSTYAIRLALQNMGLMKAILALSAKHLSKCARAGLQTLACAPRDEESPDDCEDDEWIRYYYETLHYVREALVYSSYTHSEELLATAIIISAYEMLDESDGSGNWQRHLKGVFWIQRSQDVDGGCGGLRQAVWWAWLRQDIWAAFREGRPCLSFWRPNKDVRDLDQHELADHAIYLLSQAVNYSFEAREAESSSSLETTAAAVKRNRNRNELLLKMERWKSYLGDEYKPLPTAKRPSDVFTPLWLHPPQFGVALQAYNFAQILVTLHSPNPTGFSGYLKMQKTLSEAVETICGIAMELKDESCQIMSAQCLYGAGLCVQDGDKRDRIISLIESCEARVGWAPMTTWRHDLKAEWAKVDKSHLHGDT